MSNQEDAKTRTRTVSHRSVLKNSLASQKYLSRITTEQTPRRPSLLPSNYQFNAWNFLQARRENQLNALFNIRKHKLDEITKANYEIYKKINTQESHYNERLNSIKERTARLPQSRFQTLDQSKIQNRKILGPISNFKPLQLQNSIAPLQQICNSCQFLSGSKQFKQTSYSKINIKNKMKTNPKQNQLPVIFQFY